MKTKSLTKHLIHINLFLLVSILFLFLCQHTSALTINNPIYDADNESSIYSYVYFGHYPQSEITGDDITDNIINANYNKYGVGIVNGQQIYRINQGRYDEYEDKYYTTDYHYYLVEPIKWKVLNVDINYLLLHSDSILDHKEFYEPWKTSPYRSWLNGYNGNNNRYSYDYSEKFNNFNTKAFTEDEYDILQLQDLSLENMNTSDYIISATIDMVRNNEYGFYEYSNGSSTRKKIATDYASWYSSKKYQEDINSWYLSNGDVNEYGDIYAASAYETSGVAPVVKILRNSSNYYINKPTLSLGKNISDAYIDLSYDSIKYNGSARKPKLVVSYNGETLKENIDYTLTYKNNINSGEATVIVSGCGDFYDNAYAYYNITPINQTISRVNSTYIKTHGNSPFRLNAKTSGDGAITYSSSNTSVATVGKYTGKIVMRKPGKTTITIRASKTNNYLQATKKITIIVKPKKITGLKQSKISYSSINLSWSKIYGVSGYEIYRYSSNQGSYIRIKTINSSNTTKYCNTGLSAGKTYKYKIRAFIKVGSKKYYGAFSSSMNFVTIPNKTKITKIKIGIGARAAVDITFKKVSCDGYQIQCCKKPSFSGAQNQYKSNYETGYYNNSCYFTIYNEGTYYARIRPYIVSDNNIVYGKWSNIRSTSF